MMNVVAICLVLTTLATAGVWSPTPEKVNNKEDVIVKEGHRTVVVEFEKDDGNTKVSISPQEAPLHEGVAHKSSSSKVDEKGRYDSSLKGKVSDTAENVKEKLKDEQEETGHHRKASTPRELVCDAFGKCKHKIASAIGKTKEVVSEKAHEAADKVYEFEEEAKVTVTDALGKVTDTVARKAHEASDKAHEAKEMVKDATSHKAHEAKERVKDAASEVSVKAKETKEMVKDAASEVSGKAKEAVSEKLHEVKGGVKEAVDTAKTLKDDVETNATTKVDATKRKASETVKEAEEKVGRISEEVKEGGERVKEKGEKDLKEILRRGREVVFDVFGYVLSPESLASSMRVLQLLGLATAYGMSIWVTFISSYILAGALPRQQFAIVQSKIYPVYFRAMAYGVGTLLLGHLLSQRKRLSSGAGELIQGFNLVASLLMLLFNLRYLEPRATKVMFERMKLEKEEGRAMESSAAETTVRVVDSITDPSAAKASSATTTTAPSATPQEKPEKPEDAAAKSEMVRLSEALKKLNSYSSFLNVLTLMALTWHLVHLGQGLLTACR